MSDSGLSDVQGAPAELGPTSELSAGAMIRNAREAAGLHVAALAVSMKIPVKKLEALEADRLDLLHDAVFVRALAASVCRALKIDPAPVLSKLPLNQIPRLTSDERGINAPFQSQSGGSGWSVMAVLSKPSALLVVVLILAGVGLKFLPEFKLPDWSSEVATLTNKSQPLDTTEQPQPAPAAPEVVGAGTESASAATNVPNMTSKSDETPPAPSAVAVVSSDVPTPKGAASKVSVSAPALMAAPEAVVARAPVDTASKPLAVASRPVPAASQALAAASRPSSAPVLPSTGMVVFKAKGPTWVKVVDAKGVVQLSKMLASGDVVGASGTTPLAVVIGRVDVTDVEVHGKAYPLTATSKDNVARFEVK